MANSLIKAVAEKQPTPVLSESEPDLDPKTAYEVQKIFVQWRLANDRVGGFKAGLTTEKAQKMLGVNFPLTGVLYNSGKLEGSPVVDRTTLRTLLIETEIGFVIARSIRRPPRNVQELRQKVSGVMPAIELPGSGFADGKVVKGVDLIAANVGAAKFIVGMARTHQGVNLNHVQVTLFFNGQPLYRGQGEEALGDQWKVALWMVRNVLGQGYKVEPGHILITGALGRMVPGEPGRYVADYGDFGKISFEVM
jgi:2-keto-4-pentenoate hydratase